MKCDTCRNDLLVKTGQQYHYTESGLNNVYLEDVELLVCENCGEESPIIPRVLDLHKTIARAIALQQTLLRGDDIRFIRKQLGLRARELSRLLRVDTSTFSRWENGGEQHPGPQSDALIRHLYFRLLEEREGHVRVESIVEQIASVELQHDITRTMFVNAQTLNVSWQTLPEYTYASAAAATAAAGRQRAGATGINLNTGQLCASRFITRPPTPQDTGAPARGHKVNRVA